MADLLDDGGPDGAPLLPRSIWVLAVASLAGEIVLIVREGIRDANAPSLALSVVLVGFIFGWVATGVVRARTARLVLAWVGLGLGVVAGFVMMISIDGAADALATVFQLTVAIVSVVALAMFHRTPWFAWQRTRPPVSAGPPIKVLVGIAVAVGVLAGLTNTPADGIRFQISGKVG